MKKLIVLLFFLLSFIVGGCSSPPSATPELVDGLCMTYEQLTAELEESRELGYEEGYTVGLSSCNCSATTLTYDELMVFVEKYQNLALCEGDCLDHTVDLNEAAKLEGIKMYAVIFDWEGYSLAGEKIGGSHAIGMFETDKGDIYIDPSYMVEVIAFKGYDYGQNLRRLGIPTGEIIITQFAVFK